MIELKHVSKSYTAGVDALKDINLTINDGEIFGIIGQSGAGKSTLIRCINMLERPTSGAVSYTHLDVYKRQVRSASCGLQQRQLCSGRQSDGCR